MTNLCVDLISTDYKVWTIESKYLQKSKISYVWCAAGLLIATKVQLMSICCLAIVDTLSQFLFPA